MEVLKERCCGQLSGLLASATFQLQVIALGFLSPVMLQCVGKDSAAVSNAAVPNAVVPHAAIPHAAMAHTAVPHAAMLHAAAPPEHPGTGRGQKRDLHGPKRGLRVT